MKALIATALLAMSVQANAGFTQECEDGYGVDLSDTISIVCYEGACDSVYHGKLKKLDVKLGLPIHGVVLIYVDAITLQQTSRPRCEKI